MGSFTLSTLRVVIVTHARGSFLEECHNEHKVLKRSASYHLAPPHNAPVEMSRVFPPFTHSLSTGCLGLGEERVLEVPPLPHVSSKTI